MSGYYGAPNDFRNYLMHYGVKGMKWGKHKRIGRDGRTPLDWLDDLRNGAEEHRGERRRHEMGQRVANAIGRAVDTQRRNDFLNGTTGDRSRANARRHEMGQRVANAIGRAAETQRRNDTENAIKRQGAKRKKRGNKYSQMFGPRKH